MKFEQNLREIAIATIEEMPACDFITEYTPQSDIKLKLLASSAPDFKQDSDGDQMMEFKSEEGERLQFRDKGGLRIMPSYTNIMNT